jgi:predicted metal-dependent peptidase
MSKLTPEQRLSKARVALMTHPKFCALSGIMLMGKVTVEEGWGTACTDGRNEWYDPKFIEQLDDRELCFVVAHENFHKMFQHVSTWQHLFEEDPQTMGVAADAVINLMIEDWGAPVGPFDRVVKFPSIGGVYDEQYRGMDAGMVYRLMRSKQGKKGNSQGQGQQGQGQQGQGQGQSQGQGKPSTQPPSNPSANTNQTSFDEHDYKSPQQLSAQEVEALRNQTDQAIRQGQMLSKDMCKKYGLGSGGDELGLSELLEPYVDWKQVMREFVKSSVSGKDLSTYARPNKRMQSLGIYMPSSYSETTSRIVGGVDVSGSVDNELRDQFFSELESIRTEVNPEVLDVLAWDTKVETHKRFERDCGETLIDVGVFRGGGGTDPACVFDYLREEQSNIPPDAIVVLTDGYVPSWGDVTGISCPVLWVVVGDSKATPPHGQVVYVK